MILFPFKPPQTPPNPSPELLTATPPCPNRTNKDTTVDKPGKRKHDTYNQNKGEKIGKKETPPSDISSIDHLDMREFVSGSPRYHLAIKGVREQFVVLEQSSGPYKFRLRLHLF